MLAMLYQPLPTSFSEFCTALLMACTQLSFRRLQVWSQACIWSCSNSSSRLLLTRKVFSRFSFWILRHSARTLRSVEITSGWVRKD